MDPYGWEVKEKSQELLAFLRPYEAWRAEGIINCGLVTVQHLNGDKEKTRDPKFRLFKGEKVFIPIGGAVRDVLIPPACREKMEEDASKRVQNFVFQAKKSDFEDKMTRVLERAHPKLIKIGGPYEDLVTVLTRLKGYDKAPIGTIHIVAHGSTRGNVNANLHPPAEPKTVEPITFEDLEKAVKEITTIKAYPPLFLPPRPLDPETKKPMPAAVRIRACRIGVHEIFLKKFKQALGPGIDIVSAPRFLQSAETVGSYGLVEFLRHEFTLLSPRKLARHALIRAFQAGDLAFAPGPPIFFDKKAVPAHVWSKWIPKQLGVADNKLVHTDKMELMIPTEKNPGKTNIDVLFQWDEHILPLFKLAMTKEKPSSPADALAKFAEHVNAIGPSQKWSDRHPFPMSARLGYKNLEALVKGYDWKVEAGDEKHVFKFWGTRQEYSVFVPLTRGSDLICNFYSLRPEIPSLQMYREDDPRFFTTV